MALDSDSELQTGQELRDGSDTINLVVCSGMVPLTALTRYQGEVGEMNTGYFRYIESQVLTNVRSKGMNRAAW